MEKHNRKKKKGKNCLEEEMKFLDTSSSQVHILNVFQYEFPMERGYN